MTSFHATNDTDASHKAFSGLFDSKGMPSCPRALVCVDEDKGRYELRDIVLDPTDILPEEGSLTDALRDWVELFPGERLVEIA